MVAVGRRGDRGEIGGGQQVLQGAGGPIEPQSQFKGAGCLHGLDPVAHHIAERADGQEATQAEGHRRCIEWGAVMEQHVLAQRNGDGEAVIADLRQTCRKRRLQFAADRARVQRVSKSADDLLGAKRARLRGIQRRDPPSTGHREALTGATRLAGALTEPNCGGGAHRQQGAEQPDDVGRAWRSALIDHASGDSDHAIQRPSG